MTQPHHTPAPTQVFGGQPQNLLWKQAMLRGARRRCPRCGEGRLFTGYTRVADACSECGLDFTGQRADDAPPYFTILVVGHIVVPLALAAQIAFHAPLWLQFAIWMPVVIASAGWLLPVCKGGLIGLQWANKMHGFGSEPETI